MLAVVAPSVEGMLFSSEPVLGACVSAVGTWLMQASAVICIPACLFLMRSRVVSTPLGAALCSHGFSRCDMKTWANKWTVDRPFTSCVVDERFCPDQPTAIANSRPGDGSTPGHRTPSSMHLPTATFYVCARCDKKFNQFWGCSLRLW
jgi:hypothetical protein